MTILQYINIGIMKKGRIYDIIFMSSTWANKGMLITPNPFLYFRNYQSVEFLPLSSLQPLDLCFEICVTCFLGFWYIVQKIWSHLGKRKTVLASKGLITENCWGWSSDSYAENYCVRTEGEGTYRRSLYYLKIRKQYRVSLYSVIGYTLYTPLSRKIVGKLKDCTASCKKVSWELSELRFTVFMEIYVFFVLVTSTLKRQENFFFSWSTSWIFYFFSLSLNK